MLTELLLWNQLKQDQIGFLFKRQWLLDGYILDFYCSQLKLAIEKDGKVHKFRFKKDEARDLHLEKEGIHIVRIKAREVLADSYSVAMWIKEICEKLEQGVFDPEWNQ